MNTNEKSLTFRMVFQAPDRTLTDQEVGEEMEKIISALREKFGVEIR
jgi:phenylalanyl-tRNA synthetase beta chain